MKETGQILALASAPANSKTEKPEKAGTIWRIPLLRAIVLALFAGRLFQVTTKSKAHRRKQFVLIVGFSA